MSSTMLAQRFYANTKKIAVEEIPLPEPSPGQVLIKIAYCGICHSDLSLISGIFPSKLPVITQGHEAAGTIVKVGAGVFHWKEGDRVIPSAGRPCGVCRPCRRGAFTDCMDIQLMAFAYDGGWAQYHLAQGLGLTRIPEGVPMDQAAILADAVATPFAAVVRTAKVHMGNAIGIWGMGGVGTHLLQLSKLAGGVPIIAIDVNDVALERAKRLGADYTFRSDDPDIGEKIIEATGGRMLDVAFDAVGIPATLRQAVAYLDVEGKAVSVGLSGENMEAGSFLEFNMKRKQILGHLGYKSQDIGMLAELLSYKRLDLSESISQIIPLSDIETGIYNLEHGVGNPIRILVDPWA